MWRIGDDAEVDWIRDGTSITTAITAAIPPVFDTYATIELPGFGTQAESVPIGDQERYDRRQQRHERALLILLGKHAEPQPWWLGYLDKGSDDVVFPDAPTVTLYAGWQYVLVEAGAPQPAAWRSEESGAFWKGMLPNLMFPADRCWLVSTLWDDDWTCIGGPSALIDDLVRDRELGPRTRRVVLQHDATPPGHEVR